MNEDFYVGYIPRAPRELAQWMGRIVGLVVVLAWAIAVTLALAQGPFAPATFEYGSPRTFSGTVRAFPAPSIGLDNGKTALLVAPGKHGAGPLISSYDLRSVDLSGTRIQRDGDLMIEVLPGTIRPVSERAAAPETWTPVGTRELSGEIADSKCYLGVMNPGEGKVHRDCAARCISGGIPPAFIARDANGRRKLFLLTGKEGRAINHEVLSYVGEPVTISGNLFRSGERFRIEIEPKQIRRLE